MNSNNPNVNKKHKSSVFSTLFGNPEALREVYSAIGGVDIPADAVISINTLSDVLYMRQINDLSFTIDDRVVILVEHASLRSASLRKFIIYAANAACAYKAPLTTMSLSGF